MIASFPAREVVVATLGVIFDVGKEVDEPGGSRRLGAALQSATWPDTGRPLFNIPVALSIMVFFALCAQCVSTLAVIGRETGSWTWPAFTFVYMTVLAYIGSLAHVSGSEPGWDCEGERRMSLGWQDLVALGIVVAAAGYLARLAWSAVTRTSEGGCGTGCGKCSAGAAGSSPPVESIVTIGGPKRSASSR